MVPLTSTARPRVCVVGAGAIGGYFGVRLAQGQADVSVLARGRTLAALNAHGWILEQDGERIVSNVRTASDAAQLGPQDVVIIAVKAYAVTDIAPMVPHLLGPGTIVVPALNGIPWWWRENLRSVDPQGTIAAHIPAANVLGAVIYPACSCPAPGVTRHHSGTRVVFGEIGSEAGKANGASSRLRSWVRLLRASGFDAEASDDIRTELWKKLLGNACFNPVSLVTGATTDMLIDDVAMNALLVDLMEEVLAVGSALGIDAAIRPAQRLEITRALGKVRTSMLQDADAGRPVELEAILGAVLELAEAHGIAMPASRILYALARMKTQAMGLPRTLDGDRP